MTVIFGKQAPNQNIYTLFYRIEKHTLARLKRVLQTINGDIPAATVYPAGLRTPALTPEPGAEAMGAMYADDGSGVGTGLPFAPDDSASEYSDFEDLPIPSAPPFEFEDTTGSQEHLPKQFDVQNLLDLAKLSFDNLKPLLGGKQAAKTKLYSLNQAKMPGCLHNNIDLVDAKARLGKVHQLKDVCIEFTETLRAQLLTTFSIVRAKVETLDPALQLAITDDYFAMVNECLQAIGLIYAQLDRYEKDIRTALGEVAPTPTTPIATTHHSSVSHYDIFVTEPDFFYWYGWHSASHGAGNPTLAEHVLCPGYTSGYYDAKLFEFLARLTYQAASASAEVIGHAAGQALKIGQSGAKNLTHLAQQNGCQLDFANTLKNGIEGTQSVGISLIDQLASGADVAASAASQVATQAGKGIHTAFDVLSTQIEAVNHNLKSGELTQESLAGMHKVSHLCQDGASKLFKGTPDTATDLTNLLGNNSARLLDQAIQTGGRGLDELAYVAKNSFNSLLNLGENIGQGFSDAVDHTAKGIKDGANCCVQLFRSLCDLIVDCCRGLNQLLSNCCQAVKACCELIPKCLTSTADGCAKLCCECGSDACNAAGNCCSGVGEVASSDDPRGLFAVCGGCWFVVAACLQACGVIEVESEGTDNNNKMALKATKEGGKQAGESSAETVATQPVLLTGTLGFAIKVTMMSISALFVVPYILFNAYQQLKATLKFNSNSAWAAAKLLVPLGLGGGMGYAAGTCRMLPITYTCGYYTFYTWAVMWTLLSQVGFKLWDKLYANRRGVDSYEELLSHPVLDSDFREKSAFNPTLLAAIIHMLNVKIKAFQEQDKHFIPGNRWTAFLAMLFGYFRNPGIEKAKGARQEAAELVNGKRESFEFETGEYLEQIGLLGPGMGLRGAFQV